MLGTAAVLATLLAPAQLWLIVAVLAVVGFLNGPMDVAMFTIRQRRTDPAWMGRAFAISMALNFAGFPVGSALGGLLVDHSVDLAVLIGAGLSPPRCSLCDSADSTPCGDPGVRRGRRERHEPGGGGGRLT